MTSLRAWPVRCGSFRVALLPRRTEHCITLDRSLHLDKQVDSEGSGLYWGLQKLPQRLLQTGIVCRPQLATPEQTEPTTHTDSQTAPPPSTLTRRGVQDRRSGRYTSLGTARQPGARASGHPTRSGAALLPRPRHGRDAGVLPSKSQRVHLRRPGSRAVASQRRQGVVAHLTFLRAAGLLIICSYERLVLQESNRQHDLGPRAFGTFPCDMGSWMEGLALAKEDSRSRLSSSHTAG